MDKYADLFEGSIKREPLSTRVDSEGDKYLCNSIAHTEYPTKVNDYMIVNMENFFQSISYETCRYGVWGYDMRPHGQLPKY